MSTEQNPLEQHKYVVVAAVDRGELSAQVLSAAFEAADRSGGELHVLGIAEPSVAPTFAAGAPYAAEVNRVNPKDLVTLVERTLTPVLQRRIDSERADRHNPRKPPHIDVHTGFGAPAAEVVWFAAHVNADLIVVGTAGRTGVSRFLMGSVAEKVVRLAGCPVTVVRAKHHKLAERVPEIEPLCPACADERFKTGGQELWCARHREHHPRAHTYSFGSTLDSAPHSESATTGT